MQCPTCKSQTSFTKTTIINKKLVTKCHVCGDFSEISGAKYESPLLGQKRQWGREKHAGDILQPWSIEKRKGWITNKDFIKNYGKDPKKLSVYNEKELKDSGLVSEKTAKKAIQSKKTSK